MIRVNHPFPADRLAVELASQAKSEGTLAYKFKTKEKKRFDFYISFVYF